MNKNDTAMIVAVSFLFYRVSAVILGDHTLIFQEYIEN